MRACITPRIAITYTLTVFQTLSQGLETLEELNGKGFNDLSKADQRTFMAYEISLRIVLAHAEPAGVFEMYQRMNSGSENLNAQQIRRAAYRYVCHTMHE